MSRRTLIASTLISSLLVFSTHVFAETLSEQNRKIMYLRDTGSGPDQKHAAIKLDNIDSMLAGCFEDILILDISTESGKKTYQELYNLMENKVLLKSISFNKDEEGDCRFESFQK